MQQRARKLWGTFGFIALLVVYPVVVTEIYVSWLMALSWWGAIAVLAAAGLLWFYPASWLVRWMAKADASGPSD